MPYVQYRDIDIWIDEEDIKWLAKHTYQLSPDGYLIRTKCNDGNSSLHRDIMGRPEGLDVDHINGNKLDFRKKNLRIVTRAENNRGFQTRRKDNKSGLTGVRWNKLAKVWEARIQHKGKFIWLGSTDDFFEACCLRKSAENRYKNNVGQ